MRVKFELVNTDKGIEVETFFFEANNFEEFKKQISKCWSGGEEIDKSTWEKYELEFTEDLFNFFLKKK